MDTDRSYKSETFVLETQWGSTAGLFLSIKARIVSYVPKPEDQPSTHVHVEHNFFGAGSKL